MRNVVAILFICIMATKKPFSIQLSEAMIDPYIKRFLNGIQKQRETIRVISTSDMGNTLINKLSDEYQLFCKFTAHGFVAFSIHWVNNTNLDFEKAKYLLRNLMESSIKSGAEYA